MILECSDPSRFGFGLRPRSLKTHVISSLSFSKIIFWKIKVRKWDGSSGPNYREGSCPNFFDTLIKVPGGLMSCSHFSFSIFFLKMKVRKWHGPSGPVYREGSCPIFFWSWTEMTFGLGTEIIFGLVSKIHFLNLALLSHWTFDNCLITISIPHGNSS